MYAFFVPCWRFVLLRYISQEDKAKGIQILCIWFAVLGLWMFISIKINERKQEQENRNEMERQKRIKNQQINRVRQEATRNHVDHYQRSIEKQLITIIGKPSHPLAGYLSNDFVFEILVVHQSCIIDLVHLSGVIIKKIQSESEDNIIKEITIRVNLDMNAAQYTINGVSSHNDIETIDYTELRMMDVDFNKALMGCIQEITLQKENKVLDVKSIIKDVENDFNLEYSKTEQKRASQFSPYNPPESELRVIIIPDEGYAYYEDTTMYRFPPRRINLDSLANPDKKTKP